MSPWLFNLVIDDVIRGMSRNEFGVKLLCIFVEWKLSVFLFTDDTVLVSDSEEGLHGLVDEFERMCNAKGLQINARKSNVMVMNGGEMVHGNRLMVTINEEELERMEVFRYLGMDIRKRGGMEEEILH